MRPLHTPTGRRTARSLIAGAALAALALLAIMAAPALAIPGKVNKADFARFQNCPTEQGEACLYGETLEGEFKLGSKTSPLVNPVVLQGGLSDTKEFNEVPIIPPRFNTPLMSKSSQEVPGGLTGLTGMVGGPVYATAELAGTPEVATVRLLAAKNTAVILPIKVHLENETLGPNCYIGSEEEPIVLHLTDGTTEPPAGTEPMTGKVGKVTAPDKNRMIKFEGNTLVDNTFTVPAAKGCGEGLLEPVITAAVNAGSGLPAAAGTSHAVLTGNQYTGFSQYVSKYDKKLVEEKAGTRKKRT
jgi:hypothetical protein